MLPSNLPTWLTAEEPLRQLGNHLSEDSLQWLQALELQVVGACRSDERLRPILRWNVSCFGSDGLLAHLGQVFLGTTSLKPVKVTKVNLYMAATLSLAIQHET